MAKFILTFVLVIGTLFLSYLGEGTIANYILILYFGFLILGELENIKEIIKKK